LSNRHFINKCFFISLLIHFHLLSHQTLRLTSPLVIMSLFP
jgi:hypothetical protein